VRFIVSQAVAPVSPPHNPIHVLENMRIRNPSFKKEKRIDEEPTRVRPNQWKNSSASFPVREIVALFKRNQ
jgi:hypothetical protein